MADGGFAGVAFFFEGEGCEFVGVFAADGFELFALFAFVFGGDGGFVGLSLLVGHGGDFTLD